MGGGGPGCQWTDGALRKEPGVCSARAPRPHPAPTGVSEGLHRWSARSCVRVGLALGGPSEGEGGDHMRQVFPAAAWWPPVRELEGKVGINL